MLSHVLPNLVGELDLVMVISQRRSNVHWAGEVSLESSPYTVSSTSLNEVSVVQLPTHVISTMREEQHDPCTYGQRWNDKFFHDG